MSGRESMLPRGTLIKIRSDNEFYPKYHGRFGIILRPSPPKSYLVVVGLEKFWVEEREFDVVEKTNEI